jgi:hypothetical protein
MPGRFDDYDPDDHIRPYNGHTQWEPGNGCLLAIIAIIVVFAVALASIGRAHARDLGQWEGADPAVKQWYETLMQPDAPASSCCGEADAYFADEIHVRNGETYAVITDDRPDEPLKRQHVPIGTEIKIPNYKLKWDRGNPTGHSIVFLSKNMYVFCFVQGGGT